MTGPKPTLAGLVEQFNQRRGAVAYVQRLQREAQAAKRTYGQPRNPFKAIPGAEEEFKEADRVARYCDFLLNEIEKKPRRKRELASVLKAATAHFVDFFVIMGLVGIAGAGVTILSFGAARIFGVSPHLAFFGLTGALAVAAIGAELWKRRRPRK